MKKNAESDIKLAIEVGVLVLSRSCEVCSSVKTFESDTRSGSCV